MADDIHASTFDARIPALNWIAFHVITGVEKIKTAIKARGHVGLGIQDERADESGGVIPALVQYLRHERQQGGQGMAEVGDRVKLGIGASKDGGVRDGRDGSMRAGFFEHDALLAKTVTLRPQVPLRAETVHPPATGDADCTAST